MLTLLKSQNIKIKYFYELNFTHRHPSSRPICHKKSGHPRWGSHVRLSRDCE